MNKDNKITNIIEDLLNNKPLTDLEILSVIIFYTMPKANYTLKAKQLLKEYGRLIDICNLSYEKLVKILNEDFALYIAIIKMGYLRLMRK